MIYLDNAATSLRKPQAVTDAVVEAMQTVGNCGRAAYDEALDAARTVFSARQAVAAFFGCPRADHVVFTANITESLNIALNGLLCPGDHVIATDLEHNSVLRPLYRLEREQGVAVSFVADFPSKIRIDDIAKNTRNEILPVKFDENGSLTMA